MVKYTTDVEAAEALAAAYKNLREEISKVIIGQDEVVKQVLTAIFCQGHSLLIGLPGLAKTLLVQTIATSLDLEFKRIQFTPDLMPSDILGAETMDKERNFKFVKGPVRARLLAARAVLEGDLVYEAGDRQAHRHEHLGQGLGRLAARDDQDELAGPGLGFTPSSPS